MVGTDPGCPGTPHPGVGYSAGRGDRLDCQVADSLVGGEFLRLGPNTVTLDLRQFVTLGVTALANQGCRAIGYIGPAFPESVNLGGQLFAQFVDTRRELGPEFHNEWIFATQRLGLSAQTSNRAITVSVASGPTRNGAGSADLSDSHVASAITALLESACGYPLS